MLYVWTSCFFYGCLLRYYGNEEGVPWGREFLGVAYVGSGPCTQNSFNVDCVSSFSVL
jgi:hypothetical protein